MEMPEFESTVGPPARLNGFYKREKVCKDFLDLLDKGNHILMSAPRRIGKTSQMLYLHDNPPEGYIVEYEITQSISSSNKFFKVIYKLIEKQLAKKEKYWNQVKTYFKGKGINEIKTSGVKLEKHELDYFDELVSLLTEIEIEGRIIVLIDEITDTLLNIIGKDGEKAGKSFLDKNRELRQNPKLYKKLQFVYAGSIGLENIVSSLGCLDKINDLYPFVLPQLNNSEQDDLINLLLVEKELEITQQYIDKIKMRMGYHIPYYYQLIFDRIEKYQFTDETKRTVNADVVDFAFREALTQRAYFKHWYKRLTKSFKGGELRCLIEILDRAALEGEVKLGGKKGVMNIAAKSEYKLEAKVADLMGVLLFDGYLIKRPSKETYVFISPLLKEWWMNNIKLR